MLNIRAMVLFAVVGIMGSTQISGQTDPAASGNPCVKVDGPVLNVPYSAQRRFTSVKKLADGTIDRSESGGSEARDSQGRTYSAGERQWTYLEGKKRVLKSEMLYRIDDPVANTDTRWDTTSKEAKVVHWPKNASEDASRAPCQADSFDSTMSTFGTVEKLGTKTFGDFLAEGTRSSYTVPAGQDGNDQPIVVVHETWYCPELKIVILETNDDPRSGKTRNELVNIVRGDPDVTQYLPPADYVVHDIRMQW